MLLYRHEHLSGLNIFVWASLRWTWIWGI